jgi:hypothetical protein
MLTRLGFVSLCVAGERQNEHDLVADPRSGMIGLRLGRAYRRKLILLAGALRIGGGPPPFGFGARNREVILASHVRLRLPWFFLDREDAVDVSASHYERAPLGSA